MKIVSKLPKWQIKILHECSTIAIDYLISKYNVSSNIFDNIILKGSTTCRFPKYNINNKIIRIDLNRKKCIILYNKKSIGSYSTYIPVYNMVIAYTSQLIHELTHAIQHFQNRIYSEVETTKNEIDYLENYCNIKIFN